MATIINHHGVRKQFCSLSTLQTKNAIPKNNEKTHTSRKSTDNGRMEIPVTHVLHNPIAQLRLQYPYLLPLEAIKEWDSRLPMDVRTISPKFLTAASPEEIDILLASPPMLAHHLPSSHNLSL
jgi:hypothetical protein